jgi:predicted nucleic acid-binding protein
MLYQLDTNILLRIAEPAHPMHAETLNALAVLRAKGDTVSIVPQNIIEFWNVATRPADQNGLGLTHWQTQAEVLRIERMFQLILDPPVIYAEWKRLVIAHSVAGKQVHDTRIVAAMNVHRITHLLTYNKNHFNRFTGIVIVSPPELILPPQPSPPPAAMAKSEEEDKSK